MSDAPWPAIVSASEQQTLQAQDHDDPIEALAQDASGDHAGWPALARWIETRRANGTLDANRRAKEVSIWTVTHERLEAMSTDQATRARDAVLAITQTRNELSRRVVKHDHAALRAHANTLRELFGEADPISLEGASVYARSLRASGRPNDAMPILELVLSHREDLFGPSHPATLWSADNVGRCLMSLGRYDEAGPLLELASTGFRAAQPRDVHATIVATSHLAELRIEQGRLDESESLLRGALEVDARTFQERRAHLWASCTLGLVLIEQGRRLDADELLRATLLRQREWFGSDDPDTLRTLGHLGRLARHMGNHEESIALLDEVRERSRVVLGPTHRETIWAVSNLGAAWAAQGRADLALRFAEEAYQAGLDNPAFGESHPESLMLESRLAEALRTSGEHDRALTHARHAARSLESVFGTDHPDTLRARLVLARVMSSEDPVAARDLLGASLKDAYDLVAPRLPSLTEDEKRTHLRERTHAATELVSLCFALADESSARTALDAVLATKDLRTEAARCELAAFRSGASSAERALFDSILSERRELAALVLARDGEEDDARMQELLAALARVQRTLHQHASTLRDSTVRFSPDAVVPRRTHADVSRILKPGQALIEVVRYRLDASSANEAYGAIVLACDHNRESKCSLVRLADTDRVDALVLKYKRRMESGGRRTAADENSIAEVLSELRAAVWDPLEPMLQGVERVYIAPDGSLHHLPFESLAREQQRIPRWTYLLEWGAEVVYVASGRDLLRFAARAQHEAPRADAPVLLIADPDFGPPSPRPAAMSQVPTSWSSVPETREFTEGVARALRDRVPAPVKSLYGSDATESNVLGAAAPRAMVIATHGWFRAPARQRVLADDPLLSSMLLLSGANQPADALASADDGRLTAYELMGAIDLSRCDMCVLVACRSALGTPTDEGGVNGLRRALTVNGARRVIVSMFDVPVRETIELMQAFHDAWLPDARPRSCHRAFRAAQLRMLDVARTRRGCGHPFWWSGFVFIGNPGDVADDGASAASPTLAPSHSKD